MGKGLPSTGAPRMHRSMKSSGISPDVAETTFSDRKARRRRRLISLQEMRPRAFTGRQPPLTRF
jgi:hypothetical protein